MKWKWLVFLFLVFVSNSSFGINSEDKEKLALKVQKLKEQFPTDPYNTLIQSSLVLKECKTAKYYPGVAKIEEIRGVIYLLKKDFVRAQEAFDRALIVSEKHSLNTNTASICSNYGVLYYQQGDIDKAILFYKKGLELEGIDDKAKAMLYTNTGVLMVDHLHEYEEGITYYEKSAELFSDEALKASSYTRIAIALIKLDKLKQAEENALKTVRLLEGTSHYLELNSAYSVLIEIYSKLGDYIKLDAILKESNILRAKLDDPQAKFRYDLIKATTLRKRQKFQEAIDLNESIIADLKSDISEKELAQTQMELYLNLKELNRFEEAIVYLEKSTYLSDSIQKAEQFIEAHATFNQIEILEKTKENALLETNIENEKKQRFWSVLFISILSVLLLILVVLQYSRNKRKQEIAQKDNELLKLENDSKHKEIEVFAQRLSEKNTLIEEFKKRLDDIIVHESTDQITLSNIKQELSELKISTDKDWLQFKTLFESIAPGFSERLRLKHPNLSSAEERLSLLLKLDYSNTQMSDVLGISKDSVVKGKYRLKLKLNIPEEITFDDYVRQL